MATRKTAKKAAKKAVKKVSKKAVRKVASKRTRPSKDSPYLSIKTGKPVTEAYALRNPMKVMARASEEIATPVDTDANVENYGTLVIEDMNTPTVLDIDTALLTGAEDNVFWAVLRKGIFSSKIVQLFTTRERADAEARQLDQESGLSFNTYVVQRAELNLDYTNDGLGSL